jgi:SAM-dependent methyltransferase
MGVREVAVRKDKAGGTPKTEVGPFAFAASELAAVFDSKYYRFGELGWGPRRRRASGYFTPDDYYEALVNRLVTPGCRWADVGCGRDVFPGNPDLAGQLSRRCGHLLGIDPDPNLESNPFVHERFKGLVDEYRGEGGFDLVTLRMVAEHIVSPDAALASIAAMLKSGGRMVIYTPGKWSPASILAATLPFALHHPIKRIFWDGEERDTFPTAYKLNTRRDLERHGRSSGLVLEAYQHLDDCRITGAYRLLNEVELALQRCTRRLGLVYPEYCLLAQFRKI